MTHPSDDATIVRDSSALPVVRNTALLSAALASHSAMLSLTAAVASITLVRVLDLEWLLGLGPAVVLTAGALAAVPAGRGMDRLGRVPVLVAGFGVGAAGCGLAALGSARGSALAVLAGLAGVGTANGATLLARTAAGDMYPPQRRARGLALVAAVRPDPKRIAALLRHEPAEVTARAAPIGEVLRRPGGAGALVAAQASWAVMVAVMTLTGAVVVDHFGHQHHDVFPIIGAHFVGMYALVIVVGDLVDRIGRARCLATGLLGMGLSVSGLLWVESVHATAAPLFGLGLGWNLSFVAATAVLADRTKPWERGSLLASDSSRRSS